MVREKDEVDRRTSSENSARRESGLICDVHSVRESFEGHEGKNWRRTSLGR